MSGSPDSGTELLERAVNYALCAVRPVTARMLGRPTPCRRWDLESLLRHTGDSLAALYEGIDAGYVGVPGAGAAPRPGPGAGRDAGCGGGVGGGGGHGGPAGAAGAVGPDGGDGARSAGPVDVLRARATRVLGAWAAAGSPEDRYVAVADLPVTAAAIARTGALEIAVHGWDIACATGLPRPVPPALASVLLRTARQLVPAPAARHPLFGPAIRVSAEADPSDRLVAFLGRDPDWTPEKGF
ncbi:maleylpyruvate isomerase family mycothiol-dependent enzyme [Streptomyces daliensis]